MEFEVREETYKALVLGRVSLKVLRTEASACVR